MFSVRLWYKSFVCMWLNLVTLHRWGSLVTYMYIEACVVCKSVLLEKLKLIKRMHENLILNLCSVDSLGIRCSLVNSHAAVKMVTADRQSSNTSYVTSSSWYHWFRPWLKWTAHRWRNFSTICIKLGTKVDRSLYSSYQVTTERYVHNSCDVITLS